LSKGPSAASQLQGKLSIIKSAYPEERSNTKQKPRLSGANPRKTQAGLLVNSYFFIYILCEDKSQSELLRFSPSMKIPYYFISTV